MTFGRAALGRAARPLECLREIWSAAAIVFGKESLRAGAQLLGNVDPSNIQQRELKLGLHRPSFGGAPEPAYCLCGCLRDASALEIAASNPVLRLDRTATSRLCELPEALY